jgi:hypothetical protein
VARHYIHRGRLETDARQNVGFILGKLGGDQTLLITGALVVERRFSWSRRYFVQEFVYVP